ncbi:LptF/LptG family permease [Fulvivirga sp. M361]|uniref:LptF/LptG family permease n=1 Tax=Fulvivirga sp. M361 TaxID=2594266 RepID=UPI00117B037F|nr:LptF/LptG family permease [Fulvivirga sp. M361]TRX51744.1 LptF/LptG family permease [Fulvivirga sp. M361]
MKKIDKLILSSFLGPFFLTFLVVVFILLTQHMLKYFDDIVGKDLGWDVLAQLFFHFAVFMTPISIPLAILLSSLMTFGNLGEHFELTAIKSAGISLLRALLPIFIFVLALTVLAFYSNNYFVPKSALEAYSLLYDIKQKKPALDLKPGAFYNGIPDFSIKVNKRNEDGKRLEDIIIYDHRNENGNKKVTLADSGAMYTILNDRYLKLELFSGNFYFENSSEAGSNRRKSKKETLSRSSFSRSEYVLDLSSFGLDRTDQSLFEGNRIMRNVSQLTTDIDSMKGRILDRRAKVFSEAPYAFYFHMRDDTIELPEYLRMHQEQKDSLELEKLRAEIRKYEEKDSLMKLEEEASSEKLTKYSSDEQDKIAENKARIEELEARKKLRLSKAAKLNASPDLVLKGNSPDNPKIVAPLVDVEMLESMAKKDSLANDSSKTALEVVEELIIMEPDLKTVQSALSLSRQAKSKLQTSNTTIKKMKYEQNVFAVQFHKILANSVACIIMFLIGAPLGAIIKRGGLGVPVLMSIIFFIIFYVISMTGEKWAKQDVIDPLIGMWAANGILFPIGLLFLRQARNDARLFDADFYNVIIERVKSWYNRKKSKASSEL